VSRSPLTEDTVMPKLGLFVRLEAELLAGSPVIGTGKCLRSSPPTLRST